MNVVRFIAFCGKLEYGRSGCIFAYISMTTWARDFKFAGTPARRLQLAMVALTQKSFSAQYAWFSHGGSHMHNFVTLLTYISAHKYTMILFRNLSKSILEVTVKS